MKPTPNQRVMVLGGSLLLIALITSIWMVGPSRSRPEIPLPDLGGAHPRVAAALQEHYDHLKRGTPSATRWGEFGMILMVHDWKQEAASAFSQAEQMEPNELRWVYLQAVLLEENDLAAADRFYARGAAINPSYAALRFRWAQVLIRLNQLDAAKTQLKLAAQLESESPHPLLALGRAAIDEKDLVAAKNYFQQAAVVAPLCREAREQLARANFLLGERRQAERDRTLAESMRPGYPGMTDPILQEAFQHEVVARQTAERADALVAARKMAAAADAFRELIRDRPELSRPRLNLASLLASQGDLVTAESTYREVTRLFPSEPLGFQGLGAVLSEAGDVEGARLAYQECIRLKPDFAQAQHALGLLWELQGDLAAAFACYRRAIEADPRFAPAHLSSGLVLQQQGNLTDAAKAINTAVLLAPDDPVPRECLKRLQDELGESAR